MQPEVARYLSGLFAGCASVLNAGGGSGGLEMAGVVNADLDHRALSRDPKRGIQADLSSPLPFKDETFDGILAKDIIEHLPDASDLMIELHRLAKPGAKLVVFTPRAIARAVWADYTHVRGFTESALTNLLDDTGWSVEVIRRFGGVPGAGRLKMVGAIPYILRVPGIGHWWGTNWQAVARRR